MIYIEWPPAAPLNEHVRMLWYTRAPQVPHQRERILPNGCIQVILNLARDFLWDCTDDGGASRVAAALIVGPRSKYEIVNSSDMADLIGLVLEPGGFAPLFSEAADRFANRSVSLEALWGNRATALRDRLREADRPVKKLQVLEAFLRDAVAPRRYRNKLVDFALTRFRRTPLVSTVRDVANETGWSERRFSQVFREEVGLPPKVWCRIQRFQQAVRQLHAGVDLPWAQLALDCGYYDQSHFANEFRAFSGIDARSYSLRRGKWANHIVMD